MTRRITRSGNVVERTVRENLILVPLRTGPARLDALYTLNGTAGFIWRQIERDMTEDDLVSRVVAEYDVDTIEAARDVHKVVDGLAAIGALTISERET